MQVNGETVGYVANEDIFDAAREDVIERINYAGSDKTELTIEPSYTIRWHIICWMKTRWPTPSSRPQRPDQ